MTKALAVILALVVLALGWQSWRMKEASQTIEQQGRDLKTTGEKLANEQPADRLVHPVRNQ